jgi:hypothetical protein
MADKKKETKKIIVVDDDLHAIRSEAATGVFLYFVLLILSVGVAFIGGHCHASPGCRRACLNVVRIFLPNGSGAGVAPPQPPNFPPVARPRPVRHSEPSAVVLTTPDAREVYEQAQRKLLEQVFDSKRWQSAIRLGESVHRANADGTYDVQVPVGWAIDSEPILGMLNTYFSDVNGLPLRAERVDFSGRLTPDAWGVVVSRQFNRDDAQKLPYSERLFDWLCRQQLQVIIAIGAVESRLTIASGRECFVTCDGHGNRLFQLHLEHESGAGGLIFSSKQGELEPIVLAGVPASALGEPIEVRVERREPPSPSRPVGLARGKSSDH